MNDFRLIEASVPGRPAAFGPADIVLDGVRLIDLLRRVEAAPAAELGADEQAFMLDTTEQLRGLFAAC